MIKLNKKNLETDRLILLPYNIIYFEEVFRLISSNKPRLIQSFPKLLKANETLSNSKDYVQQKIFDWNNNKAFAFMISDKGNQNLIGHFNIKDIDWKKKQAELSYFIDGKMEKRGLTTEALQKILSICFLTLKMKNVFSRIVSTNVASQKVAEKSGLKYEGTYYQDYITYDNKVVDTYKYGISEEDFFRR